MSSVEIQINQLSYAYGAHQALNELSLAIASRSCFGLLGPNGSGKTTLFRILATLLPLQSGDVVMHGFSLTKQPGAIRELLGVTFQSPSLDPKLTVYENLWCQGQFYGLNNVVLKQRIDEALEQLNLKDRRNQQVDTLSGGLKRRVEIAKSLLHQPRILLMDEPSSGLDPLARFEMWEYLSKLTTQHEMTVLLTTHLMDEAERCDRLMILDQGKKVIEGTPAELKGMMTGDVLTIRSSDADNLASTLESRFQVTVKRAGETLSIQSPLVVTWLTTIAQEYRSQILEITLHQPTLEDVFLAHTGKKFQNEMTSKS
jgi:ABC-2 type transport system ATP-binding protein